jgi:hypothetical protein
MKINSFRTVKLSLYTLAIALVVIVFDASQCEAQMGYFGRGTSPSRGAFRYRGPIIAIEIATPYHAPAIGHPHHPHHSAFAPSRFGSAYGASPFDRYRMSDAEFFAPNVYDRYRGVQPTRAELERERFYHDLDRMHRYQSREERYENDFRNTYASPSAMVNRYRDPYVAGTAAVPWTPERIVPAPKAPVPGLSLSRYQSRYQGYVADEDVAESLRAAAVRLSRGLERKSDGHIWIRHLQPESIIRAIDRAEHPGVLSDLVINYEGVADNPRLVLISESEGFQDVRRLLAQYVTLTSRYPGMEAAHGEEWTDGATIGSGQVLGETILSERVIGESVPSLDAPSLETPSPLNAPSQPEPMPSLNKMPLPPAVEPLSEGEVLERPNFDSLPDEADVELLPPPVPTEA